VNGCIVIDSLRIQKNRREASFLLSGNESKLRVECRGLLPDNLAEGRDVVVEGVLRDGLLAGDKVLTRCASKYDPAASSASTGP
jgi:cytochrome c-type biogenesis protein CcmE